MLSPLSPSSIRRPVLLADDALLVREILILQLRQMPGLQLVGVAGTEPDALAEFERLRPAIVVLDIAVCKGRGLEILRAIKARDRSCIVLVFTNYDTDSYRHSCLAAGADHFFSKTRGHEQLKRQLEVLSDQRSPAGQANLAS